MHKLAVYPFTKSSFPLCEFFPIFQQEYELTDLVSPVGLGLAGHDAGHATNRSNLGITVHSDISKAIDKCDALLVPFGALKNDLAFRDAFSVMNNAAQQGKTVFCAPRLTHSQYQKLHSAGQSFHYGFQEKPYRAQYATTNRYTPSVPVVFVHNLTVEADSLEVTLSLAQRFRRDGFRVSVIGARPEYNFFVFIVLYFLLDFFYGNQRLRSITQGIQAFHHYLRTVEISQKPDVILINIPGAAVSTQQLYYNESGVYLYLMTQIVRPDYAIVCAPYTEFAGDSFQVISNELHAKFGCGIDLVHLSNKFVHVEQTRHTGKEQTFYIPEQEAVQKALELRTENMPVYCALKHEERELLYQGLLKKLTVD